MRIIIDAMGGDNAPAEIVKGAVMAKQRLGVELTLVGRAEDVRACLENEGCTEIDIVDGSIQRILTKDTAGSRMIWPMTTS